MLETMKPKRDLCERGFRQVEIIRLIIIAPLRISPHTGAANYFGYNGNTDDSKWCLQPLSFCSILHYHVCTGLSSIKEAEYTSPSHKPSSTITRLVLHEQRRHISCLFFIWHYRVPLKL